MIERESMFDEKVNIMLSVGVVIPKYTFGEARDKYRSALSRYESGQVKSVYLEERIELNTALGVLPAEMITFYESGKIKRVFPLYGQISGFWTEEDEYKLAKPIAMNYGQIKGEYRVLCVAFYECGAVKSITLWEGERVKVKVEGREIDARIGISFYETGEIKSVEPAEGSVVSTPLGKMRVYDNDPLGMIGDRNSLEVLKNGRVKKVATIFMGVQMIKKRGGKPMVIIPQLVTSPIDIEEKVMVPIRIAFGEDSLEVTDSYGRFSKYKYSEYRMSLVACKNVVETKCCGNCSTCQKCKKMHYFTM